MTRRRTSGARGPPVQQVAEIALCKHFPENYQSRVQRALMLAPHTSMTKTLNNRNPTHRSPRCQPHVSITAVSSSDTTWCGDPIYVRPTLHEDLSPEELDGWDDREESDSGSEADIEDAEDEMHEKRVESC